MKRIRLVAMAMLLSGAMLGASATPGLTRVTADAPIADAAMRRDAAKIRALLKQGADVNAAQGDGMTALHWAASHGDLDEAKMLISAGARVEAVTRNGNYTPLHLAARAGNAALVRALLDGGADVNAKTSSGGSLALHLAAAQGSADAVNALLDKGAKVDALDGAWSQTPLMWAAAYNRLDAMQALIKRGANIAAVSKIEDVPARERSDRAANALRNRRVAALKAAEQPPRPAGAAGAAPNGGRDSSAAKPAGTDSAAGARVVREGAAGPGRENRETRTPRTMSSKDSAATKSPKDSAAAKGANPTYRNGESPALAGAAPNRAAAPTDSTRREERAVSYGELVGNKGGLTPLLFAVRQGNAKAALALLDAGAKVNQVAEGDHTSPLLMATINGHFDLAKELMARGADVKLASDAGATPLYAVINVQ